MDYLEWFGNHIELIIKIVITISLFFPFIKTWKACEEEIIYHKNNLESQYKNLQENAKKANEFYTKMCSFDFSKIENKELWDAEMNLYKVSVKEYEDKFIIPLKQQNEEIKLRQDKVFELRKNEWKSIVPFLSTFALMWLGIKF